MDAFRPDLILQCLVRHRVDFVVVGGLAASLHGVPHVTFDIDVTPEPSGENRERLSRALRELGARIRLPTESGGLPFDHDGASLADAKVWNLVTLYGELDLTMEPAGMSGYDELIDDAVVTDLGEVEVAVASLDAVIRSKRAADRPKDRAVLPLLEQTRDEIRRRDG